MKRFFTNVLLALMFVSFACTTSSCTPKESDPSTFDDFANGIFYTLFNGDELSCNYYFKESENFGLSHYEPSLPTPGSSSALSKIVLNLYFGQIKSYDYNKLSFDQKMTYNIIVNLLDNINKQSPEMSYMSNDYLGSYLGYQAQLPLLLMRYNLRNELDVINYFKFLDLIPATFKNYVDYEIKKANAGYGMPDFVIEKVIGQCESFLKDINSDENLHFMIESMNERLDQLSFLTIEQKENYKEINVQKVRGPMAEGYAYIRDNLVSLKGKATNNMGLAYYVTSDGQEIGKEYYQYLFNKTTGYDDTIEEAISYIDSKLKEFEKELIVYRNYALENPSFYENVQNVQLMNDSIENQIAYYQKAIDGYYPAITSDIKINVDFVAKAMEDYFSPAAYMISPIDEYENEFIYLNRSSIYIDVLDTETGELKSVLDYNYLFTTLAHEGIPGHLYQNVYFKSQDANIIRKTIRSSGYLEGWAVYSEHFVYELLKNDPNNTIDEMVINYLMFNDDFSGAINSRVDMGIHYEGWTIDQTYEFLSKYYNLTYDKVKTIFERLVEVPTNSQTYYYTYFKICDLRKMVEETQGENFDLLEFHTILLNCGPVPLKYVDSYLKEYYKISK